MRTRRLCRQIFNVIWLCAGCIAASSSIAGQKDIQSVLAQKSLPRGTTAETLLPNRIEGFRLKDTLDAGDAAIQAEYEGASGTLVYFASFGTRAEATEGLELCASNGGDAPSAIVESPADDLRTYQRDQVICWSRERYFFSVEPSDGNVDADEYSRFLEGLDY